MRFMKTRIKIEKTLRVALSIDCWLLFFPSHFLIIFKSLPQQLNGMAELPSWCSFVSWNLHRSSWLAEKIWHTSRTPLRTHNTKWKPIYKHMIMIQIKTIFVIGLTICQGGVLSYYPNCSIFFFTFLIAQVNEDQYSKQFARNFTQINRVCRTFPKLSGL